MLSILLPIYNYNCSQLISSLHKQALDCKICFEIIAIEDGSTTMIPENERVCQRTNTKYIKLEKNIGRSAIRNKLASISSYKWLLFLDCDSIIPSYDFIKKYIDNCQNGFKIYCGGRIFPFRDEISDDHILHWTVGTKREPNVNHNNKDKHFLSNNFLIDKSVFENIEFCEALKGYGHEDTLFGLELRKAGIKINYINNPVLHQGLDDNNLFIIKTNESLNNIKTLYSKILTDCQSNEIKILKNYLRLNRLKIDRIIAPIFSLIKKPIIHNLMSKKPCMLLFDIYKIGYLIDLFLNKK